jgi:hypothetical protein
MREKAKRPQPIIQRDADGALYGEHATVVPVFSTEAGEESSAVNPHHDRASAIERGRPDVEVEAILGHARLVRIDVAIRLLLHAVVAECVGLPHACPVRGQHGSTPAQVAHRRRGIGNSLEHQYVPGGVHSSLDRPGIHCDLVGCGRKDVGRHA